MRISFFQSNISRWEQEFLSFSLMLWDENFFLSVGLWDETENRDKDNSRENVQEYNFLFVSGLIFIQKADNFSTFLKIVRFFSDSIWFLWDENENILLSIRDSRQEREYCSFNHVIWDDNENVVLSITWFETRFDNENIFLSNLCFKTRMRNRKWFLKVKREKMKPILTRFFESGIFDGKHIVRGKHWDYQTWRREI